MKLTYALLAVCLPLLGCLGTREPAPATAPHDPIYRVKISLEAPDVGPLMTANQRTAALDLRGDGATIPFYRDGTLLITTFLGSESAPNRELTLAVYDGATGVTGGGVLGLTAPHCRSIGNAMRVEIVGNDDGAFQTSPEFLGVVGGACRYRRRF